MKNSKGEIINCKRFAPLPFSELDSSQDFTVGGWLVMPINHGTSRFYMTLTGLPGNRKSVTASFLSRKLCRTTRLPGNFLSNKVKKRILFC